MFRYVGLTWNTGSQDAALHASHLVARLKNRSSIAWSSSFESEGMIVLTSGERAGENECLRLADGQGIVLGKLFESQPDQVCDTGSGKVTLGAGIARRIIASSGRYLIDHYWGCYVAFLCDAGSRKNCVIRGPVSDIGCFHTERRGVHVFFSRMDDYVDLSMIPLSINWDFLKVHVACAEPRGRQTAIEGVSSIEGGECAEIIDRGFRRSYYWHPCVVACQDPIERPDDATQRMRATVLAVIHGWASSHGVIVHRLSGGFDSAVVLAGLMTAPHKPRVVCENWHSPGGSGDERRYARLAAQRAGCELIERERSKDLALDVFRDVCRSATPMRHYSAYESYRPEALLAQAHGARAVFCGGVGDALFQSSIDENAATDHVALHGVSRALLGVALNISTRRKVSVWHVLRAALKGGLLPQRTPLWHEYLYEEKELTPAGNHGLVCDGILEDIKPIIHRFVHPWYLSCDAVPTTKLKTIAGLTAEMSYDAPFSGAGGPAIVSPLCSQPLVELCLRIPTYLNAINGWDRAIARLAFAQDIPREILFRFSKGGPDFWVRETLRKNRAFIEDFLLDGLLVQKGLLDRAKLEAFLVAVPQKSSHREKHIIRQLYNEAWLRRWAEVPLRSVA